MANFHKKDSVLRRWGYKFAYALPLAALFDAFENGVSFFMMADPVQFPDWMAIIYSSFAAIKFGFWMIALSWLLLSLCISFCFLLLKGYYRVFSPRLT